MIDAKKQIETMSISTRYIYIYIMVDGSKFTDFFFSFVAFVGVDCSFYKHYRQETSKILS